MVSLTVGDVHGHDEWHLPTFDPRNENKYHYKLDSLDIYFWTQKDALDFVNGIRRVLPTNQVDVQDEPGPPPVAQQQLHHHHQKDVSAVVQKLENAAISEHSIPPPPAHTNNSNPSIPSFAPPPLSAVPTRNEDDPTSSTASPASFAPMAYNPAAPAAPEQIRHREKTPPPEDGDLVNPLHARLAQDANTPFSPGLVSGMPSNMSPLSPGIPPPQFHSPPGAPSFPGPPLGSPGPPPQLQHQPNSFGAPTPTPMTPGHPGLQRSATMPVHSPALASPYGGGLPPQQIPGTPSYTPTVPTYPQQHGQHAQQPQQQQQQHPTPPPAMTSPGLPPAPPGGFSNYSYTTQHGGGHSANDPYAIHQMAYRPTENEATSKYVPKKEVRGRLEENAGRLEKGVTGMLKRFEKKFG